MLRLSATKNKANNYNYNYYTIKHDNRKKLSKRMSVSAVIPANLY